MPYSQKSVIKYKKIGSTFGDTSLDIPPRHLSRTSGLFDMGRLLFWVNSNEKTQCTVQMNNLQTKFRVTTVTALRHQTSNEGSPKGKWINRVHLAHVNQPEHVSVSSYVYYL